MVPMRHRHANGVKNLRPVMRIKIYSMSIPQFRLTMEPIRLIVFPLLQDCPKLEGNRMRVYIPQSVFAVRSRAGIAAASDNRRPCSSVAIIVKEAVKKGSDTKIEIAV